MFDIKKKGPGSFYKTNLNFDLFCELMDEPEKQQKNAWQDSEDEDGTDSGADEPWEP